MAVSGVDLPIRVLPKIRLNRLKFIRFPASASRFLMACYYFANDVYFYRLGRLTDASAGVLFLF